MALVLAHVTAIPHSDSIALSILTALAMIIPFIILGYVCWIFYKAKRREDLEREQQELEWRNVHSS